MRRILILALLALVSACGGDEAGESRTGTGGTDGTPPPQSVDQACRDWCANEPSGPSCHQGGFDSVQPCYESCLSDYEAQPAQCGDEWIAIKDCQLDLDCEDLFGDCDSVEGEFSECILAVGTGGTGGTGGSGTGVIVDAQWNLSCPSGGVGCGSWAQETCIGDGGQRAIVGEHGQPECSDRIIATCEAIERANGMRDITLEANVERGGTSSPKFAFELSVMVDSTDDSVELCNVTIIEGGVSYDFGACGQEPPSIAQPCQLSNVSTEGNEVVFDLECDSLVNSTTGFGVHVGAVGGGPTTIRFANCVGF